MKIEIMDTDSYQFLASRTLWLPMDVLHENGLYVIGARNAYLGIWKPVRECFAIARQRYDVKMENRRMVWHHHSWDLSEEYHWDTEEPFGTAKPFALVEIGDQGTEINQLAYLLEAQTKLSMPDACKMCIC